MKKVDLFRGICLALLLLTIFLCTVPQVQASNTPPKTYDIDIGSTVDENCVLYLNFDENSGQTENKVYDSSGKNNHGTLYNFDWNENSGWVAGYWGPALSFGVDDYVDLGTPSSLEIEQGSFTLVVWAKPDVVTGVGKYVVGRMGYNTGLYRYASQWGFVAYSMSEGEKRIASAAGSAGAGKWSFIVGMYDADADLMKLYVDGAPIGTLALSDPQNLTDKWYVGCIGTFTEHAFDGTIDEVRIYNRALTAEEIMEHYKKKWSQLTDTTPRISWSYYDEDGDNCQSVQIQVGTFPGGNDMWDYQENSSVTYIDYTGSTLARGTTYYLRIRTNDGAEWSEWRDNLAFRLNQLPIASNLQTDGQTNPTHLTDFTPTFTWSYLDNDNDNQAEYQVQVGTSLGDNSIWDTCQVSSSSTSVVYAGSALSRGVTYYWQVRVYDGYEWSSYATGTFRPETNWMQIILYIVVFLIFVAFMYVLGRKMFKHISIRAIKKRIKFSKFEEMAFQIRGKEMIPFILIIICVVAARFIDSGIFVLAVFIITLAIYAWRKYDSRMLVGTAIFLLVVCAALLASGSEHHANDVAIWAYYFLVIGVLGLFIEYLREKA